MSSTQVENTALLMVISLGCTLPQSSIYDSELVKVVTAYLLHGDATLAGKLLLRLLWRVGVGQVRVKVLVQHLRRLLAEVSSLAPASMSNKNGR